MKSLRWMISYIFVAAIGIWLAFAVSTRFMTPALSQNAPSNGDLPAEFLKEIESTQVPGSSPTPSASPAVLPANPPAAAPAANPGVSPPPPAVSSVQEVGVPEPSSVPPPPATAPELPMAEGMPAPTEMGQNPPNSQPGYTYDPTGKRDPFRAFRAVRPVLEKAATASLDPLQRYDLDKMEIVGILWDVGTPRAMIRDPEGRVHTVVRNTKIGRAEGFVATIREGEIVVVETRYEDGKSFKESRVLALKK